MARISSTILFLFLFGLTLNVWANTSESPNLPVSHCYHWINEQSARYLSFKYEHAAKNNNELTFFTTPQTSNGSIAGQGLYCAKSPSGSMDYGDRVIRIEFVRDVVLLDERTGQQHCGHDGKLFQGSECQNKTWDVKLYDHRSGWYLIRNPMAIAKWSANSPELIQEIQAETQFTSSRYKSHAERTINLMQAESQSGKARLFINRNARINILKTLQENPATLNSIPSLQVLSELIALKPEDIAPDIKLKYTRETIQRVLTDPQIPYAELDAILKDTSTLSEFSKMGLAILNSPQNYKSINFEVLFMMRNDFKDSFTASPQTVQYIIRGLLQSAFAVNRITKLELDSGLAKHVGQFIQAQLSQKQNPDTLLAQRKFASLKLENSALTSQIEKAHLKSLETLPKTQNLQISFNEKTLSAATNLDQLVTQCKIHAELEQQNKSEFTISAVFPKSNSTVTLGKLKSSDSADTFCTQQKAFFKTLLDVAQSSNGTKPYFARGKIQNKDYSFVFEFLDDVDAQIDAFYPNLVGTKVDLILMSINGEAEKHAYNRRDYWNQKDVKEQFKQLLASAGLMTKSMHQIKQAIMQKKGKSTFQFDVQFNTLKLEMYANTLEDIQDQCLNYMQNINSDRIDRIKINQIGSPDGAETYNSREYWRTPAEQCSILSDTVNKLKLPLYSQIQMDILAQNGKKNFKVEAFLQDRPLVFQVDTMEELTQQCTGLTPVLYPTIKIDRINIKINGVDKPQIYNERDYWKSTDEVCRLIRSNLSSEILSSEMIKIQKIKDRYKTHLNVRMNKLSFMFYINNPEDLSFQCKTMIHHAGATYIDLIHVDGTDRGTLRAYNSNSYWKTSDEICSVIKNLVYP